MPNVCFEEAREGLQRLRYLARPPSNYGMQASAGGRSVAVRKVPLARRA